MVIQCNASNVHGYVFADVYLYITENIALHKPAWQSSQYKPGNDLFNASNAVDGLKSNLHGWGGQCVASRGKTKATWRVDLEDIRSIHHVTIYYRTENKAWGSTNKYSARFLGFSLYVSNTTDRTQGELCFHDTNYTRATIPAVLNVTCPVHGQYVIYYNERLQGKTYPDGYSTSAYNDVCEVEVYGCPRPGFYGENCSLQCPVNCRTVYCHIETGACQECKPGYKGHQCEQAQTFEIKKEFIDGNLTFTWTNVSTRRNDIVITKDGSESGWILITDDKYTVEDVWKYKSVTINVREYTSADHRSFKDYYSTYTDCEKGSYGPICRHVCGHCKGGVTCDHVNGSCPSQACEPGWKQTADRKCDRACEKGLYGTNCLYVCGHCAGNVTCDHVDGSCPSGYCAPGWKHTSDRKCDQECDDGTFGHNCMLTCSGHCADGLPCSKTDGLCPGGCMNGWTNPYCNEKCSHGSYGKACMGRCGFCADNEPCNHINGTCPASCEPGYQGEKCDTEGAPRTSGFMCKSLCANVCNAVCKKQIVN
ncbi:multiple epidermal growth factor-like domains protein 10 [Ostrea edulis]|uniref:multiple epidermal growth factor-like domains protein 10 n=1 Tax=Ostrea edulis TaxID=37623 RepID=UPI0024AF0DB3|nr:multiple epidermal growth factor-like domains protein 10 [Ostrea edulis]